MINTAATDVELPIKLLQLRETTENGIDIKRFRK